jgi:magnesium transporter
MLRAQYFQPGSAPDLTLTQEHYAAALQDPNGLLWVDFQGESAEASEVVLRGVFKFHPLAIEDAIYQTHVPKVDEWENYLYIALHAIAFEAQSNDLEMIELDVFMGKNFLVTHHDLPIPALTRVWDASQRDERHTKQGADHLLYLLLDELTVDFMKSVEEIDEEIDIIEDQVFEKPDNRIVQHIFGLKRVTLHLRRSLAPMREVLNKLARDDYGMIDSKDRIYFRDVYDHFVRLHDIAESLRDLVSGVLDTYLSVVNNRMNEIMKTLTIITTMFMPISFLAGVFGMNFFLPEQPISTWMELPIFYVVITLFIFVPIGIFIWMRRRGWM